MSRIDILSRMHRHAGTVAFLLCIGALSCPVHAVPAFSDLESEQLSVRELMRLDAEHALSLARSRSSGAAALANVAVPSRTMRIMSGEPRLTAIYGTGRQLMAEVRFDDQIYLYRSGHALPVGVEVGDDVYLLQRITASCVGLRKEDSKHHLCLRSPQWAGQ